MNIGNFYLSKSKMEEILPLLNLSFNELNNLCSINFEFRTICEDDRLWERLFLRDYGSLNYQPISWKLEYLLRRNSTKMATLSSNGVRNIPFPPGQKVETVGNLRNYLLLLTDQKELYIANLSQGGLLERVDDKHYYQLYGSRAVSYNKEVVTFKNDQGEASLKILNFPTAKQIFLTLSEIVTIDALNVFRIHKHHVNYRLPGLMKVLKVYQMTVVDYLLEVEYNGQHQIYSLYLSSRQSSLTLLNLPGIKMTYYEFIVGTDGKLYYYFNHGLISRTDQWTQLDPEWANRSIKSFRNGYILSESGELYTYENNQLPILVFDDKQIVEVIGEVALARNGNVYFESEWYNPFDFHATHFEGGFLRWDAETPSFTPTYVFWRNASPITISRALYQSLLNFGEVGPLQNSTVIYRNFQLKVSPN